MNDFLKFAKAEGLNTMHVENVMNASASYISPSILEERQLNVTQMDVFSRLMMDRIIFLGTEVNDYTANVIQAQLLYLDSADHDRDISIYLNTPGGTPCSLSAAASPPSAPAWPRQWGLYCSWQAKKA